MRQAWYAQLTGLAKEAAGYALKGQVRESERTQPRGLGWGDCIPDQFRAIDRSIGRAVFGCASQSHTCMVPICIVL